MTKPSRFLSKGRLALFGSSFCDRAFIDENPAKAIFVSGDSVPPVIIRSEEHTSELQSRFDLVCRLLLEKKKPHDKSYLAPSHQHSGSQYARRAFHSCWPGARATR